MTILDIKYARTVRRGKGGKGWKRVEKGGKGWTVGAVRKPQDVTINVDAERVHIAPLESQRKREMRLAAAQLIAIFLSAPIILGVFWIWAVTVLSQ